MKLLNQSHYKHGYFIQRKKKKKNKDKKTKEKQLRKQMQFFDINYVKIYCTVGSYGVAH